MGRRAGIVALSDMAAFIVRRPMGGRGYYRALHAGRGNLYRTPPVDSSR
ncbi:hypothetical protein [Photorhabdus sp. CRCIA-P01]|nr:hypothetical protein [Photorhabdus sp. CRCIA-P01]